MPERTVSVLRTHEDREVPVAAVYGFAWNMSLETGGLLVGKNARIELSVQAIAPAQAAVA